MNKNVLITGASGFIGTHLIRCLLQKNYNVVAVTRQAGKKSDHPALQWVQKFEDISNILSNATGSPQSEIEINQHEPPFHANWVAPIRESPHVDAAPWSRTGGRRSAWRI